MGRKTKTSEDFKVDTLISKQLVLNLLKTELTLVAKEWHEATESAKNANEQKNTALAYTFNNKMHSCSGASASIKKIIEDIEKL